MNTYDYKALERHHLEWVAQQFDRECQELEAEVMELRWQQEETAQELETLFSKLRDSSGQEYAQVAGAIKDAYKTLTGKEITK